MWQDSNLQIHLHIVRLVNQLPLHTDMEQVAGAAPAPSAWKAEILICYTIPTI